METKKIITGKDANKTIQWCREQMKNKVSQYRHAGKEIYNRGIYIRGRSYSPIEGNSGHKDIYILTRDGIQMLCYNITYHRTNVIVSVLINTKLCNKLCNIDDTIWDNYIHNGYKTRRGLFANYSLDNIDTIKNIARSHADYLGNETDNSSIDHSNRVAMRNL